jgi:enediyne biosynthesis protein E4
MKTPIKTAIFLLVTAFLVSCHRTNDADKQAKLFEPIPAAKSGIDFVNQLTETVDHNYYKYMYTYIGGGVASGDFDNDGLVDLFFVSNVGDNKLYLNEGDLKFKDITREAGIIKRLGFDAGVAVADVNNDGWLDIYITRGGWDDRGDKFANMLYINQGKKKMADGSEIVTFTEQAKAFNLADANRGVQSSFFDYDRDGDLDVFISNTPDFEDKGAEVLDLTLVQTAQETISKKGSDRLYRNEGNGTFADISLEAGIKPDIGFGLNPQVGDLNNDGWLDIYVCNDFRIPDFAYLNNGDGTFHEGRNELIRHMSFNSMGGEVADVNNDGLFDLYTLDMNPEDYVRSKTTMGMTDPALFHEMVAKNYHHQYMHNMLQINNGDGSLSEIANMAGVANTDWSWSSLMADFDLDGFNDIYVTNGVFRDVIDRDKNNEILSLVRQQGRRPTDEEFLKYAQMLPQQKLGNYLFRNRGDLTFENVSTTWVDSTSTFSNGAIYADLDNDGDLDIVVNNINDSATLLKNQAIEAKKGTFLEIKLAGNELNKLGVGTQVTLHFKDGSVQTRQFIPSRGFLSSMSGNLHFGMTSKSELVSLEVIWPDGKTQVIKEGLQPNSVLLLNYGEAGTPAQEAPSTSPPLFVQQEFPYEHLDPDFDDYQKQLLLPHKLSQTGPGAAVGDVNNDGLDDVYLGGGHTQPGQLLLANAAGGFQKVNIPDFQADNLFEDTGACFFDADGDSDLDLYVVSGSYEFEEHSNLLIDRLYLNDGKGSFRRSQGLIPEIPAAGSVATAADYDRDGDMDLFVGGRALDGRYPFAPTSFLLQNQRGKFSIVTSQNAPALRTIGMVTDASWVDMDQDQDLDLVVTGEWMGIEVFENQGGKFSPDTRYEELRKAKGWWNKLKIADVDGDGNPDILAGNLGLNYKFHASTEKPFIVYADDFDGSGTVDIILAKNYRGIEVPVRGKSCTSQQLPKLAASINTYHDFASKDVEGLIGPELKNALHHEAVEFRSGIFMNKGGGKFDFVAFDNRAQQFPLNSIAYEDFDQDGTSDLLLAGNNYLSEIETTRADAGNGIFLKGMPKGKFNYLPNVATGFSANKDVRNVLVAGTKGSKSVLVINNNSTHGLFKVKRPQLQ